MDRFDAIQTFVRVVETGSFTKAAQTLRMSRTSVTHLIQQLEARLQLKLLNRTTRRVSLTPDGAVFHERARRLLTDLHELEFDLPNAASAFAGRMRVDVPSPLARMIIVPALPSFYATYPDIQLDLGVSDRTVDLIGENVDCVIRGGEIADHSLVARRIGDLQLKGYAAPSYLARHGVPTHPSELEGPDHHIVGFLWTRLGKTLPYAMQRSGEIINVHGRYVVATDDGNSYLEAGVSGLGVLCLPDYMAKPHLARAELQPVFEEWTLQPMPLYIAYAPNRHQSRRVRAFIDWITELIAHHAPLGLSDATFLHPEKLATT
jgi:DNA-binding transcriptional LysR family regulator